MIVDTTTGEVLNPRIVHSNSRIVSHSHSHQHNHVHSYVRSNRSYFSAARRNSKSIFALFVIVLLFLNYFSLVNGDETKYSFNSLMNFFAKKENFIDLNFFDTLSASYSADRARIAQVLSYRIPDWSLLNFMNLFLDIISTIYNIFTVGSEAMFFLCECIMTLFSFLLSLLSYIGM